MLLQACLNGARTLVEHAALPTTASRLAADAASAERLGAGAVHLHVKDARGDDTFRPEELSEVLEVLDAASPSLPVGVTTGAWALPDPRDRVNAIRSWTRLPAYASVNWHEDGADQVARALLDRGVDVEAGLWHVDAVGAWSASPVRDRCLRVLVELPDGLDEVETIASARSMLAAVRATTSGRMPVLLHGEGSSCWPAVRFAIAHRLATRIGLEDTLELPDGSPAPDNSALIAAAIEMRRSPRAGRRITC